jgi:hypothetical protein
VKPLGLKSKLKVGESKPNGNSSENGNLSLIFPSRKGEAMKLGWSLFGLGALCALGFCAYGTAYAVTAGNFSCRNLNGNYLFACRGFYNDNSGHGWLTVNGVLAFDGFCANSITTQHGLTIVGADTPNDPGDSSQADDFVCKNVGLNPNLHDLIVTQDTTGTGRVRFGLDKSCLTNAAGEFVVGADLEFDLQLSRSINGTNQLIWTGGTLPATPITINPNVLSGCVSPTLCSPEQITGLSMQCTLEHQ